MQAFKRLIICIGATVGFATAALFSTSAFLTTSDAEARVIIEVMLRNKSQSDLKLNEGATWFSSSDAAFPPGYAAPKILGKGTSTKIRVAAVNRSSLAMKLLYRDSKESFSFVQIDGATGPQFPAKPFGITAFSFPGALKVTRVSKARIMSVDPHADTSTPAPSLSTDVGDSNTNGVPKKPRSVQVGIRAVFDIADRCFLPVNAQPS